MLSELGKRRSAAREAQRLQYGELGIHDVHAGFGHLPDHVYPVAGDILHHDRDDGFRNVLVQFAFDVLADLVRATAGSLNLACQRERKPTVRPNDHLALEFQLLPHGNRDAVSGMKLVVGGWLPEPIDAAAGTTRST